MVLIGVSQAPPQDQWNGQLRGFYVGFKATGRMQPFSFRTVEATPTEPDRVYEHVITHLRRDTEYEVVVRAFNGAGYGPQSQPSVVRTLAGGMYSGELLAFYRVLIY
ncbi:hypothetical protein LAZ67_1007791 [Cordylochernes scorpioides]|uniref:Fibronectin type-III domain-containing protein n=1 Tax=Cordylochernes scorpioides TaxID=51811 RepID=A0ABY6K4F0_9ARAC|nr:hypothetical protein LAZ67_1007791 [Cordylochernes scorpioides]